MLKFLVVMLVILAQVVYVYADWERKLESVGTLTFWVTVDKMPLVTKAIYYEKCPKHGVEMKKGEWVVQVQGKYWLWGWICPLCEIEEDRLIEIETLDLPKK